MLIKVWTYSPVFLDLIACKYVTSFFSLRGGNPARLPSIEGAAAWPGGRSCWVAGTVSFAALHTNIHVKTGKAGAQSK